MLSGLPEQVDSRLLVGFENSDDAGVYKLDADRAIVVTADFITPPVDDPEIFGEIAAANAISDIYAMGGVPLTCLNLVCFPSKKLSGDVLQGIIRGALNKIRESGAVMAGGHTVDDEEPKFGLAVTGLVHPDKIWRNGGALPGDGLILTKPIGSGVLLNANLKNRVSKHAMDDCLDSMRTLSAGAASILSEFSVHAATDVTGFGLAGHGLEMARASGYLLEIEYARLPVMDEAIQMYRQGISTGSNGSNRQAVGDKVGFADSMDKTSVELMFDPQTSGGLLVAVPSDQVDAILARLHSAGVSSARHIGQVRDVREHSSVILSFI